MPIWTESTLYIQFVFPPCYNLFDGIAPKTVCTLVFEIGCVLNCLVWCKSMIPRVKCDDGMEVWYMMVSKVVCYEM